MIIERILNATPSGPVPTVAHPGRIYPEISGGRASRTSSGQMVDEDKAKRIATAYRCANVLSDDIATMPMQVFNKFQGNIKRLYPDAVQRNTSYLVERQPNRWMTPFIWKKTVVNWLLFWGNAYIWQPAGSERELFILPASSTFPVLDKDGNKWYQTQFPNGARELIPDVEMVHLMINSSDGFTGRGVLAFARDTIGRQLGAHETQDRISGGGLNPTAVLWMAHEITKEARETVKKNYLDSVTGSGNAGGVAIFDPKIAKFETVTMKPSDAQFLEGMQLTDSEIANFFGLPLYKLNMGKQSYESNTQQDLDYLKTTLNPYLVQWEQAAWAKWVSESDQPFVYLRFNRESILQTDAKTRAEYLKEMILSGQMTPNEARQVNDMSAYAGGDAHYVPASTGQILADGSIKVGNGGQNATSTGN